MTSVVQINFGLKPKLLRMLHLNFGFSGTSWGFNRV